MPNIQLYTSNRLEKLADQLADFVREPLFSPFKPEVIVVQSSGMERWISMQLADRLGIWSNYKYFFPNKIISEIFSHSIAEFTHERLFNTEAVTWQIIKILPQCFSLNGFETLSNYLAGSEGYFKTYQLASRIADVFDQYLTYRPDMILDWDNGNDSSWQAELWRMLMDGNDLLLPPLLRKKFLDKIKNPFDIKADSLPERISIFGISTMPKYHMDILSAISDFITINIFFMNPCREYWADIYPEKNIAKTMKKYKNDVTSDELHLEKGNSLLASMGRLGGDFLSMLSGYDNTQENPAFTEFERDSLLHSIQCDILNLTDINAMEESPRIRFSRDEIKSDSSVRIHSCHSPLRELEVLYDNLLDMFNSDSELEPRDIIVMTPDIEIYSPYIDAIFRDAPDGKYRIPFSIADKSIQKDSSIVKTFFSILDFKDSRFESIRVLDILENSNIMNKFSLTLSDLNLIRRWIKDTNINWGIDSVFRGNLDLPGFEENTWRAGLNRMMLGYAMPGNIETMYKDILPYDIEGSESIVLGKFIEYFNSLTGIVKSLSDKYTLSGWYSVLNEIIGIIFDSREEDETIQAIRDAIGTFNTIEQKSGFHDKIEFEVIVAWLKNYFSGKRIASGFLTGGITFCAMLPMRSIPFKVVCLIGMNNNAFPAADNTVSFDLIARNPKRGDRSRRDDDRYLFLESIVSARQKLYISYVGQNIKDNSEIQPSVVVSELLDYLEYYSLKDFVIKDYIFVKHPLQPFSTRYFMNSDNLFSYSDVNFRACITAVSGRKETDLFINGKLSNEDKVPQDKISLDDLTAFFTNPAKHIITTKLGIYLTTREDNLDDKEPFNIEGLEKYNLDEIISGYYIAGNEIDKIYNTVRAGGMLPHGVTGRVLFDNLIPDIKNFKRRIEEILNCRNLDPLEINIDVSGYKLSGRLSNICKNGMVQYRYADTKPKDRIKAWIAHLVLNASENKAYPMNSLLICKDFSWKMEPLSDCKNILNNIISLYIKGQNELIRFFPESSYAYAASIIKDGLSEKALSLAEEKWTGSDYRKGEGEDEYYNLCFKNISPFDEEFKGISLKIYEIMLNHQMKIEK
ncbi:MAG: exodeoxyribonuclease V subunit gamma [Spirochaetes bacterium]|nr:exodeoxyribonuclease V subunit gamma [Spirochaetota bacterium]